ncbi:MAG: putative membrane protein [Saprospiraceae bacterium]|jgi:uncharacterized membrane protein
MRSLSPQKFFLYTATLFGIIYAFVVPPFQVPDEVNHFKYAFYLSEGHLSGQNTGDRLGGEIPVSISEIATIFRPIRFNYEEKSTPERRQKAAQISLNSEERKFTDFPNVGAYAPTPYLPQITFLLLTKKVNLPPLYLLYGCRLATLLFWIVLVYFSIKIIPEKKWLWTLCALLPASLFMNSGVSGDVVTNAVAFLLIAVLINLIRNKNAFLTKKTTFLLFFLAGILALNKFVYTPLLFLIFIVPKNKFKNRNLLISGLLGTTTLLILALLLHTKSLFIPYDLYNINFRDGQTINSGVAPMEQLKFVLSHPISFIKILLKSWIELAPANLSHYFGKFGWEKNYLPFPVIFGLLLLTIISALRKEKIENPISTKWKPALLSIAFIISVALSFTLYLQWDKVGSDFISGLQGRYFIPVLPLVWFAFPRILTIKDRIFIPILQISILAALSIGTWSVYLRYY